MTATIPPALRDLALDLRWHWATREADSGLRSSHAALVAMIEIGGGSGGGDGQNAHAARLDRARDAQARHKAIEAALARLGEEHRSALWLAYGPHIVDARALGALHGLGDAAPVAVLTAAARRGHASAAKRGERRALWPWLLGRKASGAIIVSASMEARVLLRVALTAYAAAVGVEVTAKRRSRVVTKRVTAETFSPVWA